MGAPLPCWCGSNGGDKAWEHPFVQCLLEWARAHPQILKVTMQILVNNERGPALNKNFEFFVEGRFVQTIIAADGTFVTGYEMGLFAKPF